MFNYSMKWLTDHFKSGRREYQVVSLCILFKSKTFLLLHCIVESLNLIVSFNHLYIKEFINVENEKHYLILFNFDVCVKSRNSWK